MQQVDFTTLTAAVRELQPEWVPSRVESVYQKDRYTLALSLRTLDKRGWIAISWHPQAARIVLTDPPPRIPDTFTLSQQLRSVLGGLAMTEMEIVLPWERLVRLAFAKRPGAEALYYLYVEPIGKYSNLTLTDADNLIITTAHQVSNKQSSVRTIETGRPYEVPPSLTDPMPNLEESIDRWIDRVSLIPGKLNQRLVKSYRGLSTILMNELIFTAGLDPVQTTDTLSPLDWEKLFEYWQIWLRTVTQVEGYRFNPYLTNNGYSVMGWGISITPVATVNAAVETYYTQILDREAFSQLKHQLTQKLGTILAKLRVKANTFKTKLQESTGADEYRTNADLLMAYLQEWSPGMKQIILNDFQTGEPVTIKLEPEKNAIQNAQFLYKRHQKLKRAKLAVDPLLAAVQAEIDYLEQVEESVLQIQEDGTNNPPEMLQTLLEIKKELIDTGYFPTADRLAKSELAETKPRSLKTPSGFELLIGRNNRQNDVLTFKTATEYDLWFHAQEIAGSHGLLRITPGAVAEEADLQFTANAVAYYSRARQSQAVPVVYTETKHVYKPKGAKPGMVIYKHEQIIWGHPQILDANSIS
ncbi:NFACT RNA binding domain-containing protein [Chamaesiphon sp. GL140_3_metabinner_50]|uniref:Rqc2 family fibronectin-binding protein n=1 Tax=Chamaesiphon sp. GL140_3_metabinner_50 TaxID=2970812 RepID=UPI0025E9F3DC|nr:NFACT RNA binding domain-containing protein [Chamaesiphon sp. GL140_3_metabinner_50]